MSEPDGPATPPAPTVVVYTDPPTPRVEISLDPVPADAWTWTVWRNVARAPRSAVRGVFRALAAAGYAIDYEVPFGTPVSYTVEVEDVNGVPSELSPPSAPIEVDIEHELWLTDPLNPTTGAEVSLVGGDDLVLLNSSLTDVSYAGRTEVLSVIGSRLPVAAGDARLAPANVNLDILAPDLGAAAHLRELIYQAQPMLMRGPPVLAFLDGALYLAIDDASERPYRTGMSVFSLVGTGVRAPVAAVLVEPRTWDDLAGEAESWNEVQTRFASWVEVLRGASLSQGAAA